MQSTPPQWPYVPASAPQQPLPPPPFPDLEYRKYKPFAQPDGVTISPHLT
jgi:hypothetical protein